jgi:hypothetical protein
LQTISQEFKGLAFGKTILIGDQFVQRGVPAIVSALLNSQTISHHTEKAFAHMDSYHSAA